MKKMWVAVKRPLFRESKHRKAMGECIWLYGYMLDIANWETGTILEWKDTAAAEDMEMQVTTVREQRRKLAELGYITCKQKQYSQEITIHKWVNPRNYGGDVLNIKPSDDGQGAVPTAPSSDGQGAAHGEVEAAPSDDSGIQGEGQGEGQVTSQNRTPTSSSTIKESENQQSGVVVVVGGADQNPHPATTSSLSVDKIKNPFFKENLITCAKLAISQPQADLVSNAMPLSGVAVTPDFIAQHVAARIQGESIGLAIVRIKAGEIPRDLPHGVTVSNGEIHVESANEPRRYSLEDWLSGVQT